MCIENETFLMGYLLIKSYNNNHNYYFSPNEFFTSDLMIGFQFNLSDSMSPQVSTGLF